MERGIKIGSHTFFLGTIVSDTTLRDGLQVNVIHGFYLAVRPTSSRYARMASVDISEIAWELIVTSIDPRGNFSISNAGMRTTSASERLSCVSSFSP